jgi:hypothetical protein
LCLKGNWSDFDPQAYNLYGEDQNLETSFKGKALQAAVDSWCKIQVLSFFCLINNEEPDEDRFGGYWSRKKETSCRD